jgi:hypothetical protein
VGAAAHLPAAWSQTLPAVQSAVELQIFMHVPSVPHLKGAQSTGVPSVPIDCVRSSLQRAVSEQVPPTQKKPVLQSPLLRQSVRHEIVAGSQAYLPHDDLTGTTHAPAPSQVPCGTTLPPSHVPV